jgi:hypothetical protein
MDKSTNGDSGNTTNTNEASCFSIATDEPDNEELVSRHNLMLMFVHFLTVFVVL